MKSGLSIPLARGIIKALLRPVVRYCVRNSTPIQELLAAAKELYLEAGRAELEKDGRVNISRMSILTGLQRHEINRLLKAKTGSGPAPKSVFSRVILSWQKDRRFSTLAGGPRALGIKGRSSEFFRLVESITTALSPSTVLIEMKRLGLVEIIEDKARLLVEMLSFEGDLQGGFDLLSKDLESLIRAAEHNLTLPAEVPHLHIRTEFDNISVRYLPEIRHWLIEQGQEFHRKAREYLSRYDKDINPELAREAGRGFVALGAFSWTE